MTLDHIPFRVIVCGSRGWTNRLILQDTLYELVTEHAFKFPDPVIVHGAARGADRLWADEAGKAGLLTEAHPADWEHHGKGAGPRRNERMASLGAILCIAAWDGKSAGTADMLRRAQAHGIPTRIVRE